MRRLTSLVLGCFLSMATTLPGFAADNCTSADVKNNVGKASQLLQQKGQAAFQEIGAIRFCGTEGYIYVTDINGVMLVHETSPHLVGKSVATIKDPTGKLFYAEALDKVKTSGTTWFHYKWPKPGQKEPSDKCGYAQKVTHEGKDYVVASGLYDIPAEKCKD